MQLISDCVKLQKQNGFKPKKKLTATIKDDADALQELVEIMQAALSEAADRDLPLDKAFAAIHVALLKGKTINSALYENIINDYRNNEPLKQIRQVNKGVNLLQEIHNSYKKLQ